MADIKLNLGCGLVTKQGWVNVDRLALPGVDVQADLFQYPWDTLAQYYGQVDEILVSHLAEHIPHEARCNPGYGLEGYDGFFCFFHQCWLLLKPTGLLTVEAPHVRHEAAFMDPTHTRYLNPLTFNYLNQVEAERSNTFDYKLGYGFKVKKYAHLCLGGSLQALDQSPLAPYLWNSVWSFRVELEPIYESLHNG